MDSVNSWALFPLKDFIQLGDVLVKYDSICAIEVARSEKDLTVINSVEIVTTGGRVRCKGDDAQAILEHIFHYNVTPIKRAA